MGKTYIAKTALKGADKKTIQVGGEITLEKESADILLKKGAISELPTTKPAAKTKTEGAK